MDSISASYDIFVCGGSRHFRSLKDLLPKLYSAGRVHLASITLADSEIEELTPYFDVLHKPQHAADPYLNFQLFCIREVNRLAQAPYFIKMDADTYLEEDWVEYVRPVISKHEQVVLFGPVEGRHRINVELSGLSVRQKLGADVKVANGRKVIGGFYVANTRFFKQHDRFMKNLHRFLFCSGDGASREDAAYDAVEHPVVLRMDTRGGRLKSSEDTLRSLVVNAIAGPEGLLILNSEGRVVITLN